MIHLTFDYKTDEKCTTPGQYLKYHRTFQGLTTRELAEKVGIVPATLVLYENDRHPIKYKIAVALANALGIDRNIAASNEGYDFSQLPLRETKANLVYSEENNTYEWVVSYIVENEAEPYLLTTIDALTGTVLSITKINYFELYDQWELQRQLPHDLWSMEDLVLFDTLYRRSDLLPRYTLPTENDLSKETAIQVSREELCDKFNLSNASLDKYECSATLMQDIGNQRKWYVCFVTIEKPTQANVQYQVTLDAQTSEVISCTEN